MEIAKLTDVGKRRQVNQDQVGVFYDKTGQPMLILCDGMGGHNAGDVAAEMALYQLGHAFEQTGFSSSHQAKGWLQAEIEACNQRIYEKSQLFQDLQGMGTTIVVLVIIDDFALAGHVGDSRLYLITPTDIEQKTKDHSYVQELVDAEMITPEEADHHPQKNIITRSLGSQDPVQVDLVRFYVNADDVFLLCSDGLTDMLTDQDIYQTIVTSPDLKTAVNKLVDQANAAGGRDNISVVLARREGGGRV
ncbi:protein phosphatase [Aerococcus urinaehominis]|uniref:protein-serine/threonine phosphatase n=1 Tax=Aerococcus urinaehominis TaxID=128944 RepID=A0A0X8FKX7_9LACT|nr:Stp1/IreP family PP2C-type Ser/Thr phosphatase [Aerococcus urinaehominis]AMB98974.1 protein phosphatase [Aerococcus urinaehominis]SDM37487.1 protein phosphatase [Aerococcus urinaehominis]